jgi:hypothetical protein
LYFENEKIIRAGGVDAFFYAASVALTFLFFAASVAAVL